MRTESEQSYAKSVAANFKRELIIATVCSNVDGIAMLAGLLQRNYLQFAIGLAGSLMCVGYSAYAFVDSVYQISKISDHPLDYIFN